MKNTLFKNTCFHTSSYIVISDIHPIYASLHCWCTSSRADITFLQNKKQTSISLLSVAEQQKQTNSQIS